MHKRIIIDSFQVYTSKQVLQLFGLVFPVNPKQGLVYFWETKRK